MLYLWVTPMRIRGLVKDFKKGYVEVLILFLLVVSISLGLTLLLNQRSKMNIFPYAWDYLDVLFRTELARGVFFGYVGLYPENLGALKGKMESELKDYNIEIESVDYVKSVLKDSTRYFIIKTGKAEYKGKIREWMLIYAKFLIKGRYYNAHYLVTSRVWL